MRMTKACGWRKSTPWHTRSMCADRTSELGRVMNVPLGAWAALALLVGFSGCMAGGVTETDLDPTAVSEQALSAGEEGWHGWEANFNGAPANVRSIAMAKGPIGGALEVFAVGEDGTIHHNFVNASGWHGWQAGFDFAPPGVALVALAQGPIGGALEVFAVARNGALYHNFLNASGWHGWEANFDGAPAGVTQVALAQGPINRALEVFAVTSTGTLYHNFLNASGWHGWEKGFNGAPAGVTQVAVALDLSGNSKGGSLEVLAVANGTLYRNYLNNGGWHGWDAGILSAFSSNVASVSLGWDRWSGALDVVALVRGRMYMNGYNSGRPGGGWSAMSGVDSVASVTMTTLETGPYLEMEIFALDSSGTLYRNWSGVSSYYPQGSQGFTAGFNGAPSGVSSVSLSIGPSQEVEVFAISHGSVYHNYLDYSLAAPTNLSVHATSRALILGWTDSSALEAGYRVIVSGTEQVVATVGKNATYAIVGSLLPNTTYCFGVQAYNATGVSPATKICGTTLAK